MNNKSGNRYRRWKRGYVRYRNNNKEFLKILDKKFRNLIRFGGNREIVLERDNWTCQMCGMNNEQHILLFGRGITVHHLDGKGRYSENKNNNLDNLQTLCLRCHGRITKHKEETNEKAINVNNRKR